MADAAARQLQYEYKAVCIRYILTFLHFISHNLQNVLYTNIIITI